MAAFDGLGPAFRRLMATRTPPVTQVELAKRLGVGPTAITKYVRPDWNPEVATLERALDALGCTVHDLAFALDDVNGKRVAPGLQRKVTEKYMRAFEPDRSPDYYRGIADALEQVELGLGVLDEQDGEPKGKGGDGEAGKRPKRK